MTNENIKARRYSDSIDLLARVCLVQHPEADSSDVADAIGHAIGQSLPPAINAIALVIDVIDASPWPSSQAKADLFVGRYIREYRMLARRARAKGLRGLDPLSREVINSHYPLREDDDLSKHAEEKDVQTLMSGRSICIEMLDEADDERSPIFESTRIVMKSGQADRMTDYIAAWIDYMIIHGHPDIIIGQRLKQALSAPRLAVLSSTR